MLYCTGQEKKQSKRRKMENQGSGNGNNEEEQILECPPVTRCSIRLWQFKPAWTLHAILRALNLPYVCENVPSPIGQGHKLPILIVGQHIVSQDQAWKFLKDTFYPRSNEVSLDRARAEQVMSSYIATNLDRTLEKIEFIAQSNSNISSTRNLNLTAWISSITYDKFQQVTE